MRAERERGAWSAEDRERCGRDADVAVDADPAALEAAARDFGGVVTGVASGVARPVDGAGVARLVRFAFERGLALTPRGLGKSQSGQSVPRGGVALDLGALDAVGEVDVHRRVVACGAGARYREVVARARQAGLTPRVAPLNLDLSVGGVLAAGGFGSTSHVEGAAVSHVASLEVVTGRGERVACTPDRERATFDAILGGLGRAGVMTRAEIELRPRAPGLRTFCLMYDDLGAMLADQRALSAEGRPWRPHHMEGFCSASVQGLRKGPGGRRQPFAYWSYGLHVSVEYEGAAGPSREAVLEGLRPTRVVHVEDDETDAFAARYDVRFDVMRATGAATQAHPWLECLVPVAKAAELLPRALEMLPLLLGDGHRVTWIVDNPRKGSVAFPEHGPSVTFAVLPLGVHPAFREPALGALEAVHRLLVDAGGKRYLSGYLFDMDEAAWRAHYGADFARQVEAKRTLDPAHVFGSALPFPD